MFNFWFSNCDSCPLWLSYCLIRSNQLRTWDNRLILLIVSRSELKRFIIETFNLILIGLPVLKCIWICLVWITVWGWSWHTRKFLTVCNWIHIFVAVRCLSYGGSVSLLGTSLSTCVYHLIASCCFDSWVMETPWLAMTWIFFEDKAGCSVIFIK